MTKEKRPGSEGDDRGSEQRAPYEPPAIEREEALETTVLGCSRPDAASCGPFGGYTS